MAKKVLVLGGTRSGKSAFAEKICLKLGETVAYIATGEPFDEEMKIRIAKHRRQRPSTWQTVEAYRELGGIAESVTEHTEVVILDCVTVYINNLMYHHSVDVETATREQLRELERYISEDIDCFVQEIADREMALVMVSDEVGLGIVPENKLSRIYRDMIGIINQRLAKRCDEVYLVVSGIPLQIKGQHS